MSVRPTLESPLMTLRNMSVYGLVVAEIVQ